MDHGEHQGLDEPVGRLARPFRVDGAHQAMIHAELALSVLEDEGFVPAGADDGAELVEVPTASRWLTPQHLLTWACSAAALSIPMS